MDEIKKYNKLLPKRIIEEVKEEFIKWLETRKFAPVIKALKKKLKTMKCTSSIGR